MTGGTFWKRTNALIKARNTTQEAIASIAGIKYQTLRQMSASGTFPRANATYKIATALGTTVEYFVTGKEPDAKQDNAVVINLLKEAINKLS